MKHRAILAASCLSLAASVCAYERQTHEELSIRGLNASVNTVNALPELGLEPNSTLQGERRTLTGPRNVTLSIGEWLRAGAHDEDDTFSATFARYRNHFFDPTPGAPNGGGLSGVISGLPAPDWSLETPANPDQHHSYPDARTYLLKGLTQGSSAERQSNLAATFYTLGHIVHVVQDLAQPQHTRNDSHGTGSLYEQFTNDIVLGRELRYALPYSGGPVPAFPIIRDLWLDQARFTNQNFVSDGTNFRFSAGAWLPSERYANPQPHGDTEIVPLAQLPGIEQDVVDWCGTPCLMRFIASKAQDSSLVIPRASSYSIFTQDLATATAGPLQVSLNRYNFLSAQQHLIPRAVSYTTGLLDYFFRGKVDLAADPVDTSRLLVKNLGPEPMKGKFKVYYDDEAGTRRPVPATDGTPVTWDTEQLLADAQGLLASGASMSVPGFPTPTAPPPKTVGDYMLVFTGEMGDEKPEGDFPGAVVGKQVRGPTYNGALYIAGLDANGEVVSFKVDKGGVAVLSGWDISKADANNPNGVLVSNAGKFDPLGRIYQTGRAMGLEPAVMPKSWTTKQATIETTPFGLSHRWASATFFVPYPVIGLPTIIQDHFSYIPNFPTSPQRGRAFWVAESPDPSLGRFEFLLLGGTSQILSETPTVSFTRRYMQDGQPRVAFGSFTLPAFGYGGFFQVAPVMFSGPLISPDGLTISGLPGFGGTWYKLVIELGVTPTARLELEADYDTATTGVPAQFVDSTTGTCSLGYTDFQGNAATAVGTRIRRALTPNVDSTNEYTEQITIGYVGDRLVRYTRSDNSQRHMDSFSEWCSTAAQDWATGSAVIKVHHEGNGSGAEYVTRQHEVRMEGGSIIFTSDSRTSMIEQSFTWNPDAGDPPDVRQYSDFSYAYSYEGTQPSPPATFTRWVGGPRDYTTLSLHRPLTGRLHDAITNINPPPNGPTSQYFRGQDVTDKPYIADASPLGEVFFATADMNQIVHEPISGGMPAIGRSQIPANIVRLLGVVWL